MIYSMTGYGVRKREVQGGALQIELKSVNSRFLDLHFRLGEELRQLEPQLRELITGKLQRGKVECRFYFQPAHSTSSDLSLNRALLGQLTMLNSQVRESMTHAQPLSVGEVLRWPGMLGDDSVDFEALTPVCLELAKEALEDFAATRGREGAKLADVIREKVAAMRTKVREVQPHIPAAQQAFHDKLKLRLTEALGSADDERIRQEVVLFATRIDVAEEIARLTTHLDEVERVLKQGGSVGKRLDFLMQELNREANTLGSKSLMSEVSATAMDLKLLIEQMREQVQNLE